MADILENTALTPQCHYFVVRKKRLCRMTVRPGRQYCGEHEPKPKTEEGQDDTRIPCPYDPKHTCYASKLEKHLSICNAKQTESPPYIIHNINAPTDVVTCIRKPLSEIPKKTLLEVIDKVNILYLDYIKGITQVAEQPIHPAVLEEFSEGDRTERSRRHMRQASSILHLTEEACLVQDQTCYVELGAGKGQLSYYMGTAWCDALTASSVLVIDRAALRHKRDNKLKLEGARIRADLAHLSLGRVDKIQQAKSVVSAVKHLCGIATDYALRCVTAVDVLDKVSGIVLATCCHHRCEQAGYIANKQLQELGITGDDLNTMLGIVSWATCGDGRSRERRRQLAEHTNDRNDSNEQEDKNKPDRDGNNPAEIDERSSYTVQRDVDNQAEKDCKNLAELDERSSYTKERNDVNQSDRNSKNLTEMEERSSYTRQRDFMNQSERDSKSLTEVDGRSKHVYGNNQSERVNNNPKSLNDTEVESRIFQAAHSKISINEKDNLERENNSSHIELENDSNSQVDKEKEATTDYTEIERDSNDDIEEKCLSDPKWREEVGRRAKALLDWGRVLYLKEKGFDARLWYYVPATVSPENVCIVATKPRKH